MKDSLFRYRWICAATLLFWILTFVTPPLDCDFQYIRIMPSSEEVEDPKAEYIKLSGAEIKTVGQWAESVKNHYLYHDNGRLANFMAMGQSIIPHWVYDIGLTFCYAILLVMMLNFARLEIDRAGPVAAMALSLWWFVNWHTPMLSVDYMLNYLFSASVSLSFVWMVTRRNCKFNLGLALLALIAGCSHEGFSVPFCIGLFVWLWITRKTITREQIWLCLIYLAGTLFSISSPALLGRFISSTVNSKSVRIVSAVPEFIRDNWFFFPAIFVIALTWMRHKARLLDNLLIIPAVAGIISILIFVSVDSPVRALWPEQLSLIIILFAAIKGEWLRRPVIAALLWTSLILWEGSLIYWQNKLAAEAATLTDGNSNYYRRDFTTFNDTPLWLNYVPSGPGTFIGIFEFRACDTERRAGRTLQTRAFFPTTLNFNDSANIIPGNMGAIGSFPFFAVPKVQNFSRKMARFTLGPGSFWKCKNIPMALFDKLTGKLSRDIEFTIMLEPIGGLVTDSGDTLSVYEPVLWQMGATKFGRPILKLDTIPMPAGHQR